MGNESLDDVDIPEEVADLVPGYLKKRREDLESLKSALQSSAFEVISKNAHSTKGSAGAYGFNNLGLIAAKIETLAKEKKAPEIAKELVNYQNMLDKIDTLIKNKG